MSAVLREYVVGGVRAAMRSRVLVVVTLIALVGVSLCAETGLLSLGVLLVGVAAVLVYLMGLRASAQDAQLAAQRSRLAAQATAMARKDRELSAVLSAADRALFEARQTPNEERFRTTLEEAAVGVAHASPGGRWLRVNGRFCEITGYTRAELLERSFDDITHPEDVGPNLEQFGRMLAGDQEITSVETRYVRRDGRMVWVHLTVSLVRDTRGEPGHFICVVQDITDRKQAEQALRESEERFRALMENATDVVTVLEPDGTCRYQSASSGTVLGHPPEELLGENIFTVIHDEDRASLTSALDEVLASSDVVAFREIRVRHADDSWRTLDVRLRNLLGHPAIGGIVVNARDVTEQRRTEEQLRGAQRMEAIGRLAGGVAHDFNNLLTGIKGYSTLVMMELPGDHPLRAHVAEIDVAADRAAALTHQLLAFSRKQVLRSRHVDLNSVIRELSKLVRRVIGEDIRVRLHLAPDLWGVFVDVTQIEQVLMNLVVNARDAMPEGGELTIETRNVMLTEQYAAGRRPVEPGPYVAAIVSDTGVGISAEVQERIFEPFFTTKEVGKGTGLGLSTVYGIVKQSGGYIWVYSELSVGTTFKIYLPQAGRPEADDRAGEVHAPVVGGSETVLFAEDEDGVRRLVYRILSQYGYEVLTAETGTEALRALRDQSGNVDLLISDVVMPGMTGKVLADRAKELEPDLPVLFVSGYTEDEVLDRGVLREGVDFIEKPFSPDDLARKVRQLLDRATSPPRDDARVAPVAG